MVPSLWSVNFGYLESHFFGSMRQVDFLLISEQYISFHADCQWEISVFNYDDYCSPKNIMIITSCNITKKKGNHECPLCSMFWASIYLLDELAVVCGNASSAILHYFFEEGITFKCLFVVCMCSFFISYSVAYVIWHLRIMSRVLMMIFFRPPYAVDLCRIYLHSGVVLYTLYSKSSAKVHDLLLYIFLRFFFWMFRCVKYLIYFDSFQSLSL
jgi:hypothetical protein